MTAWAEWVGAVGGSVGGVAAVVAVIVSVKAQRGAASSHTVAERSAHAAEGAADAATRSADAAESSAVAADRSATQAERASTLSSDRRHDELHPRLPGELATELDGGLGGTQNLFATITVPRDYRVRAVVRYPQAYGQAERDLGLPVVLHAGQPHRFHIEQWPPDRDRPEATEVFFRFWPPTDADGVQRWACPCSRPADSDSTDGHWEVRARILQPPWHGAILV
jgi:hypothetical protein